MTNLFLMMLLPALAAQPPIRDLRFGETARQALVIGNNEYPGSRLTNPVNDAQLMARVLKELDFGTTVLTDATLRQMEAAIDRFVSRPTRSPIRASSEPGLLIFRGTRSGGTGLAARRKMTGNDRVWKGVGG